MGSHRILALLELAEECPTQDELAEFLADPDPDVRKTALSVLSEATEDWSLASPVFAAALADPDPSVRTAAIELLRELREVLVPVPEFGAALRDRAIHGDPPVRVAAVGALWRHRLSSVAELAERLADPAAEVRGEAVLGLVSLDALDVLARAVVDQRAEVRLAVARGIATVGDPRGTATLIVLAGDADPLVRAEALTAMARTGCTEAAARLATAALADPAWQVREGAAIALGAADPGEAADALVVASRDPNLDVRKAAVRALGGWLPARPELRAALESAERDADADVRAYARMSLHPNH
ncbi:MAG TPA: HEAT repeat domain-containing protein [Pseudonocardia sp.]